MGNFMNSQIQSISENLTAVATHPTHPRINPEAERQFASKVLALTGILQTTLETNELIALFAKEMSGFVEFDGIRYLFPSLQIDISLGQQSQHACEYQLVVSGEELGGLKLFRFYPFKQKELETIENLLAALLYPLRNTLLYQRAVQTALIDPLTGVKNRSTMDSAMHREIELSHRQGSLLCAILLDIDHFKQVNDEFGHLYGDQALRAVAQCAEQTIRDSDMLFRYGGEEFLILLSGTNLQGARMLAERIRQNIGALDPHPEKQMHLTASLGVTCLQQDDTAASLLSRADNALYRAKQAGRDRVTVD